MSAVLHVPLPYQQTCLRPVFFNHAHENLPPKFIILSFCSLTISHFTILSYFLPKRLEAVMLLREIVKNCLYWSRYLFAWIEHTNSINLPAAYRIPSIKVRYFCERIQIEKQFSGTIRIFLFLVSDDGSIRWFCCTEQARGSRATFRDENINHNTPFIFQEDITDYTLPTSLDTLNLFDFHFDKGTALIEELDDIFKMTR